MIYSGAAVKWTPVSKQIKLHEEKNVLMVLMLFVASIRLHAECETRCGVSASFMIFSSATSTGNTKNNWLFEVLFYNAKTAFFFFMVRKGWQMFFLLFITKN